MLFFTTDILLVRLNILLALFWCDRDETCVGVFALHHSLLGFAPVEVENNLSTTTPGAQLDARQGRLLGMSETENESKLIAINTVLDAEIAETRSMQVMRLPGEDTENAIPANASTWWWAATPACRGPWWTAW